MGRGGRCWLAADSGARHSFCQEKGRPKGRSLVRSMISERLHVNARGSADREFRDKRESFFEKRV